MRPSLRIGSVAGIPILVHFSWLFLFGVVYVTLLTQFQEPRLFPPTTGPVRLAVAAVTTVLFFGCILAHELAHSLVALRYGLPVHSITLFVFGGVSQIVREAPSPVKEFFMALSGPATSAALGALFLALQDGEDLLGEHFAAVAGLLMYYNFALAAFNMLPGFPLDGGRVLRAILWSATGDYHRATGVALRGGEGMAVVFVAVGVGLGLGLQVFPALWLALVGWFLGLTVRASRHQFRLHQVLKGLFTSHLMEKDPPAVEPSLSLAKAVEEHLLPLRRRALLVLEDGRPVGVLGVREVRRVPRPRWADTPVREAMTPLASIPSLSAAEEALRAVELLEGAPDSLLVVLHEGKTVGVVTQEAVWEAFRLREQLGV